MKTAHLRQEVELGANICTRIKRIYFSGKPWHECCSDVSSKFNIFKAMMKKFYTEKSMIAILIEVQRYSDKDIQDVFDASGVDFRGTEKKCRQDEMVCYSEVI
jgi:hypothetical protein